MILPSLNNLLLGNQYLGIEHFSLNDEEKVAVLWVEKKKQELVIIRKDNKTFSDTFLRNLNKSTPLYLVINTNQVIHKEISDTDASDNKLIHKAFPNLKGEDFYFEIWRLKTKSIVAISRKTYINEIISKYKENKIEVTGISLGICSISEIVKFTKNEEFITNHQSVFLNQENENTISNSSKKNITYNINGLDIQNSHLLAFSGILILLLNNKVTTGNLKDFNNQLYYDYNQKSFFFKGLKVLICFFLTILMTNFFVFNYYFKKAQENTEKLSLDNNSIETINKSKERIKIKEQNLKNLIAISVSSSKLINEITKKVPQSILLNELIYLPIEKKIKEGESITIEKNTILISGTTINNKAFTKWIEDIEKLAFLKEVIITHFGKNENNETIFSIKLIIKTNETK